MESLYLLIPIALLLVSVAAALFFWAVDSGQFDDLDNEANRILFDEKTGQDQSSASDEKPAPVTTKNAQGTDKQRDNQ